MAPQTRKIFVILPFSKEFSDVYHAITEAARRSEEYTGVRYEVFRADRLPPGIKVVDAIQEALAEADLIIADTSGANPNVLYEVGFAKALDRPIVFINQREYQVPFDIAGHVYVLYDRDRLTNDLVPHLMDAISHGIQHPEAFRKAGREKESKATSKPSAFVSYSHADSECLRRLQVHMRPLEKKGVIEIWDDTKIKAGDKWREQIEAALDRSVIAVLLISADFLASDFIVDNELPPLLAAAEDRGTKILPVILKPCRFARDENLSRFQAINKPSSPLLTLDEIAQEQVWDNVAQEIEIEIENRIPKKP